MANSGAGNAEANHDGQRSSKSSSGGNTQGERRDQWVTETSLHEGPGCGQTNAANNGHQNPGETEFPDDL